METAKEELQSSNEELTTLNEELQTRNLDLSRLNDDLTNFINSVNIAIVMLDSAFRVRRFTPSAKQLFRLIGSDIGRPFSDINTRVNIPDVEPFVREVLDSVGTREIEIRDDDGRWYNLRVRPYKTLDNKVDGAVLALMDINDLKQNQSRLETAGAHAIAYAEAIMDAVRKPVLVLTQELRIRASNRAFSESFGVSPEEALGQFVSTLADRQFDLPELRTLLRELAAGGNGFDDLVLELTVPRVGRRRCRVSGRRLEAVASIEPLILLAFDDLTTQAA